MRRGTWRRRWTGEDWMRSGCLSTLLAVSTLCLAFAGAIVPAASQPVPTALQSLLVTPDHRAALLQAAHAVDGPGMPTCPSASYMTTGDIGILGPVQTNAAGHVTAGAWKETIQETGCGTTRMLNALTLVQPNGTLQTRPLLPGTTITDPQLQQDSVQYAAAGLGDMPAGCDQGGVLNTRFVGQDGQPPGTLPAPGSTPLPWTEVWTLIACAKKADVTMHFTPDATGTDIHAELPNQ